MSGNSLDMVIGARQCDWTHALIERWSREGSRNRFLAVARSMEASVGAWVRSVCRLSTCDYSEVALAALAAQLQEQSADITRLGDL